MNGVLTGVLTGFLWLQDAIEYVEACCPCRRKHGKTVGGPHSTGFSLVLLSACSPSLAVSSCETEHVLYHYGRIPLGLI